MAPQSATVPRSGEAGHRGVQGLWAEQGATLHSSSLGEAPEATGQRGSTDPAGHRLDWGLWAGSGRAVRQLLPSHRLTTVAWARGWHGGVEEWSG